MVLGKTGSIPLSLIKTMTVSKATITISGPKMSNIIQEFTITGDTTILTMDVPLGEERLFLIEGMDEKNIVQLSGSKTIDITQDVSSITIKVKWLPPIPVNLYVSNITSTTAELTWDISDAPDFYMYRLLLGTKKQLQAQIDGIKDIFNRNEKTAIITGMSPNTTYYLSVVVIDTEHKYDSENSIYEFFTTPSGNQVINILKYDDGMPNDFLVWYRIQDGLLNRLTTNKAVKLTKVRYYIIKDFVGGSFRAKILSFNITSPTVLGAKDIQAQSSGWVEVDFSADNITVNGDFFVMLEYVQGNMPLLAFDSVTNGRGWNLKENKFVQLNDKTFFIRAVVESEGGLVEL